MVSEGTGGVGQRAAGADAVVRRADAGRQAGQLVHRARQPAAPGHPAAAAAQAVKAPILLIAATNRADSLDPALLRPGRFDRRLTFAAPDAVGRRALVDHFLARRSADAELDDPALRDRIAAATNGWTPVMIEHLLDEALVNALRRGSMAMTYADVEHARITEMVGIGHPVRYTDAEQRLIATHEAVTPSRPGWPRRTGRSRC